MKLLLVGVDLRDGIVSLALPQLAAYLRAQPDLAAAVAVETRVFWPNHSAQAVAQQVIAARPDLLGVSLFVWSEPLLADALHRICAALPALRVVLGGPQVQARVRHWFKQSASIVAVIEGEGEQPLAELVRRLVHAEPLTGIGGVHARGRQPVLSPPAAPPAIATLRQMPSVYLSGSLLPPTNVAYVETARGCPYRCGYCDFGHQKRQVRYRRWSVVEQELRWLRDHGVDSLVFIDPVFNAAPRRPLAILRLARQLGFTGFSAQIRAELLGEALAAELGRCQALVGVGLQSTNAAAQRLMGRACPAARFERGVAWLKQHGVAFKLQLVCGLPGDTFEGFCNSLDAALAFDPVAVEAFTLQVLPGTRFYLDAKHLGLRFDRRPPHELIATPTLDRQTLFEARGIAQLAFQLHFQPRVRAAMQSASSRGVRQTKIYRALAERAVATGALAPERLLIAGEPFRSDEVRRLCTLLEQLVA